ncbi:MAG: mechanosensitive ion channel, partial [Deltaproteobacteria bacterium]|nr:mechanosensitive ion channel [Deltaproteobacteria bacterium]
KLVAAILIFIIGRWISRRISKLMGRLLEKNNVEVTLVRFAENMIYYALIVVVIIAAIGQLGINTTSFLTIVGVAGLAIGLALKDSLSNFAAGVMLILFRPFRVGNFVGAGGVTGTVQKITMFNTILHSPDNQRVIVPNSVVTSNVITNVTANTTRRVDLVIGISYDDDVTKAKKVLTGIINAEKRILPDPAPNIAVSELGDSSVNFVVRPWVKTEDYWNVYFDLTEKIKITFDKEGISIPYPQQDVHLVNEQPQEA